MRIQVLYWAAEVPNIQMQDHNARFVSGGYTAAMPKGDGLGMSSMSVIQDPSW